MGTVFKKEGKYLRYNERTTHTGTHRSAEWVDDLQRATVFHTMPPLRLRQDEQLQDAEKLEAMEIRGPLEHRVSLEWTAVSATNDDCHYNHCISETPFGRFLLTWKGWKDDAGYGFDETPWGEVEYHGWATVEDAQQWASQEMVRRIAECLKANAKSQVTDGQKAAVRRPVE